jgi:hypothetical protein
MAQFSDISAVEKRVSELSEWIQKNAPEAPTEQKHLDEGTQERAYWNYGYMVALRDVLRLLTGAERPSRKPYNADKSSSYPAAMFFMGIRAINGPMYGTVLYRRHPVIVFIRILYPYMVPG